MVSSLESAPKDMIVAEQPTARQLKMGATLRYARGASLNEPQIDGYPNFHYLTVGLDGTRASLESGINAARIRAAIDGKRRPFIALRSSPWKAGHETNPWNDVFDLDHGNVRYFGDHKSSTPGTLGSSRGNAAMVAEWPHHRGGTPVERARATPLVLFRSTTVGGAVKGYVEFCGVAVIERLEHVVQRDPTTARSFVNYVFDLAVFNLTREDEKIDWRWIDDRLNSDLTLDQTLRFAPHPWRSWIEHGDPALPRLRRRVASSSVRSAKDQRPETGSPDAAILSKVYEHFHGQKHRFELLAARVAGNLLRGGGSVYHEGWITRGSGDGGADFVGRLDVGRGAALVPIVVLGQAKCVFPDSSISAEQIARVVARLRRGWIGVFVTTGVFSRPAQLEIVEDQYPVLLVDGRQLAEEVNRLAFEGYGGDVDALLTEISDDYLEAISPRRPEEILHL